MAHIKTNIGDDEDEDPQFEENILIDQFLLDSRTFVHELSYVDKARLSLDQNDDKRNVIFHKFDLKSALDFQVTTF
jgi:hypothetical protein